MEVNATMDLKLFFPYAYSLTKNKQDAEDIIHDCFLRVLESGIESFNKTYINAGIKTLFLDKLRYNKLRNPELLKKEGFEDLLNRIESKEDLKEVMQALILMSKETVSADVLILNRIMGVTYNEIASKMNIQLSTAITRGYNADKKLKSLINR